MPVLVKGIRATACLVAAAAGAAVGSTPPPSGEIRALVQVVGRDGKRAPGAGSVVWVAERSPVAKGAVRPTLASRSKRFEPRVLVVPAGTTVDFPNFDGIYHNVFSPSEKAGFDLGLYRNGASKSKSFESPGLVLIYCNIHPQMAAYVLVVDGPLFAQADAEGVALLAGVPAGRRAVKVWDEKGGEWSGPVEVAAGKTTPLVVTLDASAWRESPHKNKHGRDYPPPGDDDRRY